MSMYFDRVERSVNFLEHWNGTNEPPEVCIVLGSGLANAIPGIDSLRTIGYGQIPGFQCTNVEGHRSELAIGRIEITLADKEKKSRQIVFLRGRNHGYEGFDAAEVVHNVRTMIKWGAKAVFLTNAAGALTTEWPVGSLMAINDQINFTGENPLSGAYGEGFGPRFLDMTFCYCPALRQTLAQCAEFLQIPLKEGTYLGVKGPNYETPAEVNMFARQGAMAVGMSTVLEAMAAHHMGAKVAAISCLTNLGAGLTPGASLHHQEVLNVGNTASKGLAKLVLSAAVAAAL